MVPRLSNPDLILEIVDAIRDIEPSRPLHIFGIGSPTIMRRLFKAGADSADSSTYVRQAVSGRYLDTFTAAYRPIALHNLYVLLRSSGLPTRPLEPARV